MILPKSRVFSQFDSIMVNYDSDADTSGRSRLSSPNKHVDRTNRSKDTDEIDLDPNIQDEPLSVSLPHTVTIPCHHIRVSDILLLKGRPCQVTRISMSAATGQFRYLGVDLFTKQLHEESSSIHHPAPGVVVQTMQGPILKQWHVLDVNDGYVVAMTDSGDVKQRLPVLDQSNLWARLNSAFESGRGSVRIMVVRYGGSEIAVDMKVLHGSTFGGDGRSKLLKLAQAGDFEGVEATLESEKWANINDRDESGKTAIFHAIQNCHPRLIDLLTVKDNNFDIADNSGKTALDYAVGIARDDFDWMWVPESLMKKGASPTNGIDPQTLTLLTASARGNMGQVQEILDSFDNNTKKVKVNSTDRLGYTALHEAAYFGKYDVAKKLIDYGADTKAQVTLGGDTVLHAVIERRAHRSFLGEGRKTSQGSVLLGPDHSRVIELLLEKEAPVHHRRSSDKKTVQELVFEKLKAEKLSVVEQSTLQQILIILKGHSLQAKTLGQGYRDRSFKRPDGELLPDSLRVRVQYHHPIRSNDHLEERSIFAFGHKPSALPKDEEWAWIHLPKNNKAWVKEVMHAMNKQKAFASKCYLAVSTAFLEEAYDEIRCGRNHPGMRRPSFAPFPGLYHKIFSLVIPYFDSESLQCLESKGCSNKVCKKSRHDESVLKETYDPKPDPESYDPTYGSAKNWHEACTLDQSYYISLKDRESSHRNHDQVVVKHKHKSHKDNILMVKQMWIWKTDYDTLITAFPDRRRDHGKADVETSLWS